MKAVVLFINKIFFASLKQSKTVANKHCLNIDLLLEFNVLFMLIETAKNLQMWVNIRRQV